MQLYDLFAQLIFGGSVPEGMDVILTRGCATLIIILTLVVLYALWRILISIIRF